LQPRGASDPIRAIVLGARDSAATDRPAVSVIVVNYRSAALAASCLRSLDGETVVTRAGARGVERVVVDNASTAEERGLLEPVADRLIANDDNRGFAAAVNQGLAASAGELLLFLNPDTELEAGALQRLVDALESDASIGAVGPRIRWDREGRFLLPPSDPPTLAAHLLSALADRSPRIATLRERRWQSSALAYWKAALPTPVEMLSGACILTTRATLDAVGSLDERFFLYFEDADWCRRVIASGRRLVMVPSAVVTHFYNQSAKRDLATAGRRFAASAEAFFRKHYGDLAWRVVAALAARIARKAVLRPTVDLGILVDPPRLHAAARPAADALFLLSPLPSCMPAIGSTLAAPEVTIPIAAWQGLAEGEFHARLLALPGLAALASWRWRKASAAVCDEREAAR